jgi:hypothetical protein
MESRPESYNLRGNTYVVRRNEISEVEIVPASCTVEWVAAYDCHILVFTVIVFEKVYAIIATARG